MAHSQHTYIHHIVTTIHPLLYSSSIPFGRSAGPDMDKETNMDRDTDADTDREGDNDMNGDDDTDRATDWDIDRV
jgi:hypothetical protein